MNVAVVRVVKHFCYVILCCLLWVTSPQTLADESEAARPLQYKTTQLLEIQDALNDAVADLAFLRKESSQTTEQQAPDLFADLRQKVELVNALQLELEKTATGGLNIQTVNAPEQPFDWRKEMASVIQPVVESLKNLTNTPRKTSELRNTIKHIDAQKLLLEKGLAELASENAHTKDVALTASLNELQSLWQHQIDGMAREKVLLESQLKALDEGSPDWWQSLQTSLDSFFAGRALTLLLAVVIAVGVWLMFRILNRHLWRRHAARRGSPLYRFCMYSFHAFSTIFMVLMVFTVFYIREDVLLLGLGIILLIGGLISLQQALPRFLKEVNLLLNLGTAREGERVIYNGVPYRIKALNVFTTLFNPSLDGIHRLSMEQLAKLHSRPILNNETWFPSEKGDVLQMSDGSLVTVEQQSVEQVILKSLSGPVRQYNTARFLELDFVNLSRSGSFVVSTVFGLDYRYQDSILKDYPDLIRAEIPRTLEAADIDLNLYQNVNVEFKTASASSLDLLVWATFDSQLASSFFKLERSLQQACLTVCNKHDLTIPFPQLAIHVENNGS